MSHSMSFMKILILIFIMIVALAGASLGESSPKELNTWRTDSNNRIYSLIDESVNFGIDPAPVYDSLFSPSIILKGDNKSSHFKIQLPQSSNRITTSSDTIGFADDVVAHRFYRKSHFEMEWEIILKHKPDKCELSFPIETDNLIFYYQNPDTLKRYSHRLDYAENIPGSYAVYSVGKSNDHSAQGKLFHIYRPQAWDSNYDTVWCDLSIDTLLNLLTIDVPDEFIRSATYPVVVDPTFGYNVHGEIGYHLGANDYRHLVNYGGHKSAVGVMQTAYICGYRNDVNAACTATVIVYDYDPTLAGCLKISTSDKMAITKFATGPVDAEWFSAPISGRLEDGIEYIVSWQGFESCDYCLRVCADYTGTWGYECYYNYTGWGTNDDLAGYSSNSYRYSVYVEYETIGPIGNPYIRCRKLKRSQ